MWEETEYTEGMGNSHLNLKEYFDDISNIRKLQSLEKQRKEAIQKEIMSRMNRQRMKQTDLEAIYSESQKNLQRKLSAQFEEAERRVKQTLEEQERLSRIQDEQMREVMLANSKRIDNQQKKLEQWRAIKSCMEALERGQEKFKKGYQTFVLTLMSIDKSLFLNYVSINERANMLITSYEHTIKSIAEGNITESAVKVIEGLAEDLHKLQQEFVTKIAQDVAAAEEAKQKLNQEAAKPAKEEKASVDQTDALQKVQGLNQFISPQSQKHYTKIMNQLVEYSSAIEPLSRDENDSLKKFRINCQKAINIPVNAISDVSADHLRDKYDKLAALLSGTPVSCGSEQVNTSVHPLGQKFCTVLLSKKFVSQAGTEVASNPKAAFALAAVIVALWQKFPDFGVLFLAHAYRDCPYLVPYFIPQFEGQSTEDYMKLLGYKVNNGQLEPQNIYLSRMAGIARLYAAILVTKPRMGEAQAHPHDLNNGWIWLCNILNLEPLPEICATMILEVLQIAGEEMRCSYGKQFLKLIFTIQNQYFPKLELVDEGGPKSRLQVLLETVMKEGKFSRPDGVLQANFW